MKLFNTLGRKLEQFKPIKPNLGKAKLGPAGQVQLGQVVGIYSCGPTVYWYQHIGNLRSYIFSDILKRTLIYNKFKVKHVMNITDVGHLTSDEDTGEDKMLKALRRENLPFTKESISKIAKMYTDVFKKDLKKLNIINPNIWCKATEHVKEQIEIIKKIEKNGFTYIGRTTGNVYFNTSKVKNYGELALLQTTQTEARVEKDPDKKNPRDFVLWFTIKGSKFKGHVLKWNSPWGEGFPGWHIECSAMSSKYLGDQFDIHTGGEDHIPVHHVNEIAQSEAAFNKKPWVKYWLHGAFLTSKGEKISKSTGGLFTVSDLEEKNYNALDYRYLCLLTHYRKPLEFSLEALDAAKNAFEHLKNIIIELKKDNTSKGKDEKYQKEFEQAINDDLNIPKAIGIVWELLKDEKLGSKQKLKLLFDFDKVFGLNLNKVKEEKITIPKEIKELINQREQARKNKDFKTADNIRNELKNKGFILEDSKKGIKIKKI